MKKWLLQFLLIFFGMSTAMTEAVVAADSCGDLFASGKNKFDSHWLSDIENRYQKALNYWYGSTSFYSDFRPSQEIPYRMAARHAAGEHHAVLAQKHLGYELSKDKFGTPVMRPPQTLELFIKNFEKWKKEIQLKPEDNLELVFIFIKSNLKNFPSKFEDYLVLKASDVGKPGVWPDPALYKDVSNSFFSSQLPAKIFVQLLNKGYFLIPAGNFLDHEIGHLTELISQSAPGRESFIAEIRRYSLRQSQKKTWDKKIKFREALLFEFFALPDLAKSEQIKILAQQYGISSGVSLKTLTDNVFNKLIKLPDEEMLTTVKTFAKEFSPLIYRQGGASRDNYNFQENLKPSRHKSISEENGLEVPSEHNVEYDGAKRVSADSLVSYLHDLERGLPELMNADKLESILFQMENNWSPKVKVTPEEYRKMATYFLAARMSRIMVALTTGVELGLTPVQTIREGLVERFNPKSALGKYLDSFLPEKSPTREAFNLN